MSAIHSQLLRTYGLSPKTGFLPEEPPSTRLSDEYYSPWEDLIHDLANLVSTYQIRSRIDELPILDTSRLKTEEEWRRSYVILGCNTQAYVWVGETPSDRLPPQITVPLLAVSSHLGLAPMNTYATIVLWNYAMKRPSSDPTNPSNLHSIHTMTGTRTEEWFYLISVALEASGGPIILELLDCMENVNRGDSIATAASLKRTANSVIRIGMLLERMYESCEVQTFYHDVRPLLSGTKGHAALGLPQGVFYDEGSGKGSWRQYAGGSNAQSSLIQFLDVALGVTHHTTGEGNSVQNGKHGRPREGGFVEEMRRYMPRQHRDFLFDMEKRSTIRQYAFTTAVDTSGVLAAYNEAVAALTQFRNIHLQMVARYIIAPSRSPVAAHVKLKVGWNLAKISLRQENGKSNDEDLAKLQGTGGTKLMAFLKQTRDETLQAAQTS